MITKKELLTNPIRHIDIAQHNVVPLVDSMRQMAFSSRDTARAADIYEMMLRDTDCGVILCLAGSLISAGRRGPPSGQRMGNRSITPRLRRETTEPQPDPPTNLRDAALVPSQQIAAEMQSVGSPGFAKLCQ